MQNQYENLYKDRTIQRKLKRNEARLINRNDKILNTKMQRNDNLNKLRGISPVKLSNKKAKPEASDNRFEKLMKWKQAKQLKKEEQPEAKQPKAFKVAHFSPTDYKLAKVGTLTNKMNMPTNIKPVVEIKETRSKSSKVISSHNINLPADKLKPDALIANKNYCLIPKFDFISNNIGFNKTLPFGIANSRNEMLKMSDKTNQKTEVKQKNDPKLNLKLKNNNANIVKSTNNIDQQTIHLRSKIIVVKPVPPKTIKVNKNSLKETDSKSTEVVIKNVNSKIKVNKVDTKSINNKNADKLITNSSRQVRSINNKNKLDLNISQKIVASLNDSSISRKHNNMQNKQDDYKKDNSDDKVITKTPLRQRSMSENTVRSSLRSSNLKAQKTTSISPDEISKFPESPNVIAIVAQTNNNNLPAIIADVVTSASKKRKLENNKLTDANNSDIETSENAAYFRKLLLTETETLNSLCDFWIIKQENENLSEEVCDQIRTSIGKAKLLMRKRMTQFGKLIDDNEFNTGERPVTNGDLKGFWDIVAFQIKDVTENFKSVVQMIEGGLPTLQTLELPNKKKITTKKVKPVAQSRPGISAFSQFRQQQMLKNIGKDVADVPVKPASEEILKTFDGGFFKIASPQRATSTGNIKTPEKKLTDPLARSRKKTPLPASPFLKMMLCKRLEQSVESDSATAAKSHLTPLFSRHLHLGAGDDEEMSTENSNSHNLSQPKKLTRRSLQMSSIPVQDTIDQVVENQNNNATSNRRLTRKSVCFGTVKTIEEKENVDIDDSIETGLDNIIPSLEGINMKNFKMINVDYTPRHRRISGFTPPNMGAVSNLKLEEDLIRFSPKESVKNSRRSLRYSTKNLSPIIDQ